MLPVSERYLQSILADSREMPYRIKFDGSVIYDQSQVTSLKIKESASSSSGLSIGTANSNTLTLVLKDAADIEYDGILIEPESGLVLENGAIEWIPLGKFWVTSSSTKNDYKTLTLECADGMYHMSGDYISKLTYPASIEDVTTEIVSQAGVEFVPPAEWPDVVIRRAPKKMTLRNAIGYAAGCCGKNARFNRAGKLEFYWYGDSGVKIERTAQYLDGVNKLNRVPLKVKFEVTGTVETYNVTIVSDGNGGVTASPGLNVTEGETITLSINPFYGYELAEISAVRDDNGESITLYMTADGGRSFIQPDSNVTVTASFRTGAKGPFELITRASDGGSIVCTTPSGNEAGNNFFDLGDTVGLTIAPADGYELDRLVVTPSSLYVMDRAPYYSFAMPQSDVAITAYFREAVPSYKISLVDLEGNAINASSVGWTQIRNVTTGAYSFREGDLIELTCYSKTGYSLDYFESDVTFVKVNDRTSRFSMPARDVTIIVHTCEADDESKEGMYSWLQTPATPPTNKKYWAVLYKEDWDVPVCQRYWLVWFNSWSATGYDVEDEKRIYHIRFDGYYYCGSQNVGHGSHAWDASIWSGNGASGSTLEWDVHVGGHAWSGSNEYVESGNYSLLASNTSLYHNSSKIFEKCESAIQSPQTSYIVNGEDVREKGSLTYWKCPDTYSTPLPASNWMILNCDGYISMKMGDIPTGEDSANDLYILFFDSISIKKIGAVFSNRDEEFYTATVTNGHYCKMKFEGSTTSWDLHDITDGAEVGLRNPLIATEEVHGALGGYYFSGILASSVNLYADGELLCYANRCKVCDCEEAATASTFNLRRTLAMPSDTIIINNDNISAVGSGDSLLITVSGYDVTTLGDSIVFAEQQAEQVTMTYTNPFIYEKAVASVSVNMPTMKYTPMRVKHRGNPALQAGDIVTVPDKNGVYHTVLIMQQTMTFGGGMNSEISCPGETEKTKNFSAEGPLTAQIKQEVERSSVEIEERLAASNALMVANFNKTIGDTQAQIKSVVEWQTAESATISRIDQTASENRAGIKLFVKYNSAGDPAADAGLIIQAINGKSTAKIKADRLDIEGKELNIKVNATNITGTFTVKNGDYTYFSAGDGAVQIGGWNVDNNSLWIGDSFKSSNSVFLCTGSAGNLSIAGSPEQENWVIKAGPNFGVNKGGDLWCSSFNLGSTSTDELGDYRETSVSNEKFVYERGHSYFRISEVSAAPIDLCLEALIDPSGAGPNSTSNYALLQMTSGDDAFAKGVLAGQWCVRVRDDDTGEEREVDLAEFIKNHGG